MRHWEVLAGRSGESELCLVEMGLILAFLTVKKQLKSAKQAIMVNIKMACRVYGQVVNIFVSLSVRVYYVCAVEHVLRDLTEENPLSEKRPQHMNMHTLLF